MQTVIQKLEKTAKSLVAHTSRGNSVNGYRSCQLIDRYESLKEQASTDEWNKFCESKGYSKDHNAYDFFA